MHEPQIVEYRNMRVLTTQQLAQSYNTSTDTITKNFNRNKERYTIEEHYFALEGEEKTQFLDQGQFDRGLKNAKTLYLWTQKGTLLHAKSLNTDVAWEVYGRLVDNYFSKSHGLDVSQLSPELQMFKQLWDMQARQELEQKRQAEQINRIEQKQETMIEAFASSADEEDFKAWANRCIGRIAESENVEKSA